MEDRTSEQVAPAERCGKCGVVTASSAEGRFAQCGKCRELPEAAEPVSVALAEPPASPQASAPPTPQKRETKQVRSPDPQGPLLVLHEANWASALPLPLRLHILQEPPAARVP